MGTIIDYMKLASQRKASDIHITVNAPVALRIHGELQPADDRLLRPEDTLAMVRELLTGEQYEEFLAQGDYDCSYELPGISRFRINVYRQKGYAGLTIRLIPSRIPAAEELGLPAIALELAKKPQGLVLVTGPTGSGKSTTLAALINSINTFRQEHIITLEDPIEFLHPHKRSIVNQREVGSDTESFSRGLRAALRQDPDVILVGEMRDLETISAAVTAAETGHLVMATLHTTDAPQTIDRIIDAFPGHQQNQIRLQLASVLLAVVSQRLFPRTEGKGRLCATEILVNTPAVSNLIRSEKTHQIKNIMQTGRSLGMHTLDMAIRDYLSYGLIHPEAAKAYLAEVRTDATI